MSDEESDDTDEDLAPTKLSSFMRAALADQPVTGDTVKVSLPTGKTAFPLSPLGPFRYALVDGIVLENKDGKWVDKNGDARTVTLAPPNNVAAHRP